MTEFPSRYSYKSIADNPHHVMSIEGGRLFFVNCYQREDEAIARLASTHDRYLMQSGTVQALARYRNGDLIEVVRSE